MNESRTETQAKIPLSLIMPAYNEEERLPGTLDAILEWKKSAPFELEVIVVDDGSQDRTCEVVRSYIKKDSSIRLVQEPHVGMMNAILSGFRSATHSYVANMDADCATHPREFENLVGFLKDHDISMGSRILRNGRAPIENKSLFRRILSAGMSRMFRLLFRCGISDPQMGFKIYKKEVIARIAPLLCLPHDGLKSSEILVKAHGLGYKIMETPIDYVHDQRSRCVPKYPFLVVLKALHATFALWFQSYEEYRRGLYPVCPVRAPWLLAAIYLVKSPSPQTAP
jgi:dolichyl-phosphate beta-glucosyltransferase